MRIGAVLSPVAEWEPIADAARAADELGLEAVGFWDHYHSPRPEWGYVCGWSAYGWLAAITRRVRLVPMVLNNLHYDVGVLAKESSVLSIASGGRFELGIGAGDWPESFAAWGAPYPDATTRLERLDETVQALRRLWTGDPVTYDGRQVRLTDAICTPAPAAPPRIVVGAGPSRRTLGRAADYADELNLYAEPELVAAARRSVDEAGRRVDLSLFLGWEFDKWPADPGAELRRWQDEGIDRFFVNVGGPMMTERIHELADLADLAGGERIGREEARSSAE